MKLGKILGIDLYLHWSFWLLVLFHLLSSMAAGGLVAGLYAAGFVVAVFACVVAHEYGHAAAAARYGIPTSSITVLAFGGIARLAKLPAKPMEEFVIAVAGPAVNVAIALGIGVLMNVGLLPTSGFAEGMEFTFYDLLLAANVILVLFNMLPAFPMDGGRVLRSLLAMRTGQLRATEIAARIGRWMALLFAIASFQYGFTLLIIAVFIFLAGTAELMQVRMQAVAGGQPRSPFSGFGQPGFGRPGFGPAGFAPGGLGTGPIRWQFGGAWPQQYADDLAGGPDPASLRGHHGSDDDDVIDAVDVRKIL